MENLNDDIGFLSVTVRTSNGAIPIENAKAPPGFVYVIPLGTSDDSQAIRS